MVRHMNLRLEELHSALVEFSEYVASRLVD
jgi:hypothetical protein